MPRTIELIDVVVKEVQISFNDDGTSLNVLYALLGEDGNEYSRQWRTFKSDRFTAAVLTRIERMLESAVERVREDEGL